MKVLFARLAQLVEHPLDVGRVVGSSPTPRTMRILAIETSCDETAIAIVDAEGDTSAATYRVMGDALLSQAALHAAYGGVYPTLAKREHIKNLPILLEQALNEAHSDGSDIDLIAVTRGPGLEPALWTGIEFAKALGEKMNVPVMGIDHMEGHIVSALMRGESTKYEISNPKLPLLALLISGGHTELVLMSKWFEYELIGRTKDDAVGEAFDKVARLLGLPYPGGPAIGALARSRRTQGASPSFQFPRPMIRDNTCDFSFSGLKTAVMYKLKEMPELTDETRAEVAHAFEDAARDVIVAKTKRALMQTGAMTLAVGGGVSANIEIRQGLVNLVASDFPDVTLAYPNTSLTGDNAIMIAAAAYLRAVSGTTSRVPLVATGSLTLHLQPPPVTD